LGCQSSLTATASLTTPAENLIVLIYRCACRQIEKEEEAHGRQDMALQAQPADAEIATQAQAEKADGKGTDLISLS
jgi:hypothetical protein